MAHPLTANRPVDPLRGHNNPPEGAAPIADRLANDHVDVLESVDALADRANAAPKEIVDDEALNAVSAIVKDATAISKKLEALRVDEKEPYLRAGREIDGFFKPVVDRLTRIVTELNRRNTEFLRRKADEERRQREEEARRRREIEDAERAAAEARMREAEEAERKAREAARAVADADAATAAEARRQAAEAQRLLDEAAAADKRAEQARADTLKAEQDAAAKPAEMARTRGAETLTTLRTEWVFEIDNIADVPLEPLRPYIARAEVEKAVRAFVRVGGRQMPGVRIFETSKASVR